MRFLRYAFLLLAASAALGATYLTYLEHARVDLKLADKPTAPQAARAEPGALTYRFLGNANILISDGETSILTDGWFSRFPTGTLAFGLIEPDLQAIEAGLMRAEIEELAAVIPVHSHFDHAMDSPEVALRTGALLVGSESSANIARGWGLKEDRIRVPSSGEALRFGAFEVTLIRSDHFQFPSEYARKSGGLGEFITAPLVTPAKVGDYKEGGSYSVLIRHPQATILIQGSAGYVEGALDSVDVDLLFLGVGGLVVIVVLRRWRGGGDGEPAPVSGVPPAESGADRELRARLERELRERDT